MGGFSGSRCFCGVFVTLNALTGCPRRTRPRRSCVAGREAEDLSVLGEPGGMEHSCKQPLTSCSRVERCTSPSAGTAHHPLSSWREWPGGFGVRKLQGERPSREAQHWLETQSLGPWLMSKPWLPSRGGLTSSLPPPLPIGVCLRVGVFLAPTEDVPSGDALSQLSLGVQRSALLPPPPWTSPVSYPERPVPGPAQMPSPAGKAPGLCTACRPGLGLLLRLHGRALGTCCRAARWGGQGLARGVPSLCPQCPP